MAYEVYAGDEAEPASTAESVQVAWDEGYSRPVPEAWCERIRAFEPSL